MYSSFWIYQIWAKYLFEKIHRAKLVQSLSYDKDSLLLFFERKSETFALELKFVGGELFLFESDKHPSESKTKGHFQFKQIESAMVSDVGTRIFDRLLFIEFQNGWKIWLKGFGRFGNVLLQNPKVETPESIFRLNIKADWDQKFEDWDNYKLSFLNNRILVPDNNVIDLNFWNSMVKSISFDQLVQFGFNADFFTLSDYKLQCREIFIFLVQKSIMVNYAVVEVKNKLQINHTFDPNIEKRLAESIQNSIEVANEFIRWFYFHSFKESFIDATGKKIKQDKSLLLGYQKRTNEIKERRSYREIGDLILAHAHSIKIGVSNALVMDYYTNQRIRIKLDVQLNAAENAQKYYRKAKNEFLELQKLEENIRLVSNRIELNTNNLSLVTHATQFKDIKELTKKGSQSISNAPKQQQNTLPYKQYEFEGYEIWVGKNARSNDELIRLSSKNDMWLHVRDYTGSHVIIKQKGRNFAPTVIEKAAMLAAFFSKAKHQQLTQVRYSLRKYVSKSKKALPGEVNVLQESVIDVVPSDF